MNISAIALGVSFAFIWSSAFATSHIIVADAPPLLALCLRFALAGGLALGVARFVLGHSLRPEGGWRGAQFRGVFAFGFFQNALYLGLNWVAMQTVEASLAAVIASSMPLLVAALGWLWGREKITLMGAGGLVVGMAGVAVITLSRIGGGNEWLGLAFCVLGALALAISTLVLGQIRTRGDTLLVAIGWQALVGGAILLPISLLFEEPQIALSARWIAAFVYQCLVPGILAMVIWFTLVRQIGAVRAATFHFLNPAFGVLVAAVLLGESVSALDVVGMAIAMAGILAVQLSHARALAA